MTRLDRTGIEAAEAEVERLRATIARVEAVCDKWDNGPDSADYVNVDAIRAALADENGDIA